MAAALDSALLASISSNLLKIWFILTVLLSLVDNSSCYDNNYSRSISVSSTVFITVLEVSLNSCSTNRICKWLGIFGNSPRANAFIRHVLPIPFLPTKPYLRPYDNLRLVPSRRVLPAMIKLMFSRIRSKFLPVPILSLRIWTGGSSFFLSSISLICFCKLIIAFSSSRSSPPFYFFRHFYFDNWSLLFPAVCFLANRGCRASYIERTFSSTTLWSRRSADKLNLFYKLSKPAFLRQRNKLSQRLIHSLRSTRNNPRKSAIIS